MNHQRLSNILNWAKSVNAPEDIILQLEEEIMPLEISNSNDVGEIFGLDRSEYIRLSREISENHPSVHEAIYRVINDRNTSLHDKFCLIMTIGIEVGKRGYTMEIPI